MENMETLEAMKETLIFLVEQEKIRGKEVKALNDKIDALNELVTKQIVEPAIEYYNEEQFNKFKDSYGERLGKYNQLMQSTMNNPDYDATKEAWDEYNKMSDEEKDATDMEKYVEGVEKGIADYISGIKEKLGLPENAEVEIKDDGEKVEVKADTDGNGEKETVAVEEKEDVTEDSESEDDVDPQLKEELEAYAKA